MSPPTNILSANRAQTWIVGVAAFVLGAIGGVVLGRLTSDGFVPPPSHPVIVSIEPPVYVALGDSYSAGEGVQPYEEGSGDIKDAGDNCHRSTGGYPSLLLFFPDTRVDFRACSGAVTANVFDKMQKTGEDEKGNPIYNRYGVQASGGVLNANVGLVTITMGGNDVKFSDVVKFCAIHAGCMDDNYRDGKTLDEWAEDALDELGTGLTQLYGDIRGAAPVARILVLGYPQLFPAHPPGGYFVCWAGIRSAFSSGERLRLRDLGTELNRTISEAAAAAGVEYVDTAPIFEGHEPCGKSGEWLNSIKIGTLKHLPDNLLHRGPFHPNPQGQRVLAYIVSCYLHEDEASPTSVSVTPSVVAGSRSATARRLPEELAACVGTLVDGSESPAPTAPPPTSETSASPKSS